MEKLSKELVTQVRRELGAYPFIRGRITASRGRAEHLLKCVENGWRFPPTEPGFAAMRSKHEMVVLHAALKIVHMELVNLLKLADAMLARTDEILEGQ